MIGRPDSAAAFSAGLSARRKSWRNQTMAGAGIEASNLLLPGVRPTAAGGSPLHAFAFAILGRRLFQRRGPACDALDEAGHFEAAFGAGFVADRGLGDVHGVLVTRNERVPPEEVSAFADEAIGAGARQPIELRHVLRRELHAIGDVLLAVGVVTAAARLG